jgi:hypothetical protein
MKKSPQSRSGRGTCSDELVKANSRRRLYLRSPYRERRLQREEKYDKNLKEKDKKEKFT